MVTSCRVSPIAISKNPFSEFLHPGNFETGVVLSKFNPIQARLFLQFKGPGGGLMISRTSKIIPTKLYTVIVLLNAYQNTKRNFQKYDL